MKPVLLVAGLFALALALALAACGAQPPHDAATLPPPAVVGTATAALLGQGSLEELPGTVAAARAATLEARVPGVVRRINATPGATVAAGALLVELDAQELVAQRDQAAAHASLAAADAERARQLFARQALTRAELDAAQSAADAASAAAAEAEVMLGYTRIAAPFSGVVVRRHAEVGDLLAPGRAVVELEDPATLRLDVEVPESLAAGIDVGTMLRARVDAVALDQVAAVVEIEPAADPVSHAVLVKLALPAGAQGLRSGQFGRLCVPVADGAMLAVPSSALIHRGQLDEVFVVEGGRAWMRLVRPGVETGASTAIRAGLAAGEVVVTTGAAGLRDGQPVTVH